MTEKKSVENLLRIQVIFSLCSSLHVFMTFKPHAKMVLLLQMYLCIKGTVPQKCKCNNIHFYFVQNLYGTKKEYHNSGSYN